MVLPYRQAKATDAYMVVRVFYTYMYVLLQSFC
jgi:hypothetical protein